MRFFCYDNRNILTMKSHCREITMGKKTIPIIAGVILTAAALTPIIVNSFSDNPKIANIGFGGGASSTTITAESDDITKAGYSIGYIMGQNMKQGADDLNPNDIAQGIKDAYSGKEPPITEAQLEQAVTTYQQRRETEMQQKMQEMMKVNLEKGQAFLAENGKKAGVKTTASGLQYEIIKEGTGAKPKASDVVSVTYEGKLINGEVFDSTEKHGGEPAVFPLNGVIAGWTEGLQLMQEGSKYRFYIPSNLAYGEMGEPRGGIEPNSVLIFDVELLKVNPPVNKANTGQAQ